MTAIVRCRAVDGALHVGVLRDRLVTPLPVTSMGQLMGLRLTEIRELVENRDARPLEVERFEAPLDDRMEVWASGVTYRRSRDARIEESQQHDVYSRVFRAERPELFFKAPAWRCMINGEPIGIRSDSTSNVPEPELAVLANRHGELVGALVCNDVSSRSIEGENPLYLPQAKIYTGSCSLSTEIKPVWATDIATAEISMSVRRDGASAFSGQVSVTDMSRSAQDLLDWLFRAEFFPDGVILSTGTGIVPDLSFTLADADVVRIDVSGVGSLTNVVSVDRERLARALTHRLGSP